MVGGGQDGKPRARFAFDAGGHVDALRGELRTIAAHGAVPVVFAGEVQDDILRLSEIMGTRTNGLKGLSIPPNSGLGGRALARRAGVGARLLPVAHTDVTVGSPSRALFTWNGPVVTDLESRALAGRGDPQWDELMQWLHENITAEPIHCRY